MAEEGSGALVAWAGVLVALVGGAVALILEKMIEFYRRPKLYIITSGDEGLVTRGLLRKTNQSGAIQDFACSYLRVKVKNSGNKTAMGCQVFISNWIVNGKSAKVHDLCLTAWAPKEIFENRPINISRGVGFFADVHSIVWFGDAGVESVFQYLDAKEDAKESVGNDMFHWLSNPCPSVPFRLLNVFDANEKIIECDITVTSDNAEPVTAKLKFRSSIEGFKILRTSLPA